VGSKFSNLSMGRDRTEPLRDGKFKSRPVLLRPRPTHDDFVRAGLWQKIFKTFVIGRQGTNALIFMRTENSINQLVATLLLKLLLDTLWMNTCLSKQAAKLTLFHFFLTSTWSIRDLFKARHGEAF